MNSLSAEHHNQLLFLENENNFTQNKSSKLCYRDYAKIQQQKHKSNQLENIDWKAELCIDRNDINSLNQRLKKMQTLHDFWAPLKTVSNSKGMTHKNPWITKGILKSITI